MAKRKNRSNTSVDRSYIDFGALYAYFTSKDNSRKSLSLSHLASEEIGLEPNYENLLTMGNTMDYKPISSQVVFSESSVEKEIECGRIFRGKSK